MIKTTPRQFAQSMIASLEHFPLMLDYYKPPTDCEDIRRRKEQFNAFQSRIAQAAQEHDTGKIMVHQFTAAAQWLDGHIGLTEPRPLDMGFEALAF